jgi:Fe-S cluster assembly ATP-binding protein
MSQLEIKNLHVSIEGNEILKGLDLTIEQGKVHAIMGPNGTGKSTLAYTLMGHPSYEVTEGEVFFKGQNILELEPDELIIGAQKKLAKALEATLTAGEGAS